MKKEEVKKKIDSIWNRYDKNKKGYLGRTEIKDFLEEIFDENSDDEEFEEIINLLDLKKNGKISKQAMINYIYKA